MQKKLTNNQLVMLKCIYNGIKSFQVQLPFLFIYQLSVYHNLFSNLEYENSFAINQFKKINKNENKNS